MHGLVDLWIAAQTWLFETFVSPVLFQFNLMDWFDEAFDAVEIVMLGIVQILVIALVMRPLEKLSPLEVPKENRLFAVDRIYTVLNKLGLIPLVVFILAYPITNGIEHQVRVWGFAPPRIEKVVPWLRDNALASFLVYFALFDCAAYWIHRAQHKFSWWWALHSLHHSQRQVTAWTDDRNHVLDDFLVTIALVLFSQFVGLEPVDYVVILMVGRLIESWSHANVNLGFGSLGAKLVVGPRFHRLHHALADPTEPRIHDHNFAPVFPIWDILFGTALYDGKYRPTGVDDPVVDADNRRGWFGQQIVVFFRFVAAFWSGRRMA